MRELDFVIGKKKVHSWVPESWLEVSERQFLAIVGITYDDLSDVQFYVQFFGLDEKVVREMDMYTFYVLNSLLSFTRITNGMSSFIIHSMKLKDSKGRVLRVDAPRPKLSGMTFQQFMMVDTFFTWYMQTQNKDYLISMCACCYLNEEDDFFTMDMDERVKLWKECNPTALNAVLVQWTFIKAWLSGAYSSLFPKGNVEEVSKKKEKVKISNAWIEIFDMLVADDMTRINTYKRLECMDVIRIVNGKMEYQNKRNDDV